MSCFRVHIDHFTCWRESLLTWRAKTACTSARKPAKTVQHHHRTLSLATHHTCQRRRHHHLEVVEQPHEQLWYAYHMVYSLARVVTDEQGCRHLRLPAPQPSDIARQRPQHTS